MKVLILYRSVACQTLLIPGQGDHLVRIRDRTAFELGLSTALPCSLLLPNLFRISVVFLIFTSIVVFSAHLLEGKKTLRSPRKERKTLKVSLIGAILTEMVAILTFRKLDLPLHLRCNSHSSFPTIRSATNREHQSMGTARHHICICRVFLMGLGQELNQQCAN